MRTMKEQQKAEAHVREQRPALIVPSALPLPVKLDEYTGGYIWGPENEMIADFDDGVTVGDGFRVRGWGRIQDESLMQENMQFIANAINAHAKPNLQDWLAVLPTSYELSSNGFLKEEIDENVWDIIMQFNMDTGQPNSPQDYANFNQIVNNYG